MQKGCDGIEVINHHSEAVANEANKALYPRQAPNPQLLHIPLPTALNLKGSNLLDSTI